MPLYYPLELNKTPGSSPGDNLDGNEGETDGTEGLFQQVCGSSSVTIFGLTITQQGVSHSVQAGLFKFRLSFSHLPINIQQENFSCSDSQTPDACLPG